MSTGSANFAMRQKVKASASYSNTGWDLVDAVREGVVDLAKVDRESLPEEIQSMNTDQFEQYVASKEAKRAEIQAKIERRSKEREGYVAEQRRKQAETDRQSLDQAMITATRKQGSAKQMSFE